VEVEEHVLEVVEVDGHRITRVRLHAPAAAPEPGSPAGSGTTAQQDAFADYFSRWGLFLPDDAVAARRAGHLWGDGWSVRFRWRKDGTLLVRAGHRMTNERVFAISPDGSVDPAEPSAPAEAMVFPPDATAEQRAEIERDYRSAWSRHTKAVTAAGLDYDRSTPPSDVPTGVDRQLWRLDDGAWHSETLRPRE
jgi:hypothetical protein